ncbi:MAG: hypothetical protein ACPG5Z_07795, partial [Pseudoalteromonas sp.]
KPLPVFKTGAFDHSAISPTACIIDKPVLFVKLFLQKTFQVLKKQLICTLFTQTSRIIRQMGTFIFI